MTRPYHPVRPESFVWSCARLVVKPFFRRNSQVRSGEKTAREAADAALTRSLGNEPDMHQRAELLGILASVAVAFGTAITIIIALVGAAALEVTGGDAVVSIMRLLFALMTAPVLAVGCVWSVRWILARRDLRQQRLAPSRGSQPGATDFVLAAPPCALFALFFLNVGL
ncbi:hypothetical protein J4G33_06070 [Actinotalea sp. BY-33]|uniref:Uncharacterized protein n=1 Tax=Actinotalea soli TaxID=2819234 RepID=A0A939LRL5_9CELL|nr:hypothetical protein [Actinotalea soli]MBO1751365.1 hypothetical protein [Actinotalea soli]